MEGLPRHGFGKLAGVDRVGDGCYCGWWDWWWGRFEEGDWEGESLNCFPPPLTLLGLDEPRLWTFPRD